MTFWDRVEAELNFQDKTKKELAIITGIKEHTLHKSFERKSSPSAESALKISKALNVSIEYLITGKSSETETSEQQKQIALCKKYYELIQQAERLTAQQVKAIENLMKSF
ncbi:MAG: helix-turn-helix domain-containing protein [Treponema sp.]|nr:helix-turn-helix domain-containing protein [Treponema sp.]